MDRTGKIVVALCAVLFLLWLLLEQKYAAQMQRQAALNTNAVATAQAQTVAETSNAASAETTVVSVANSGFSFDTNVPEQTIVLTNAHARYTFTSRGGGLESVELLDYPETVSPRWKKEMATNGVATLNAHALVPVLAVLGNSNLLGNGVFTLSKTDDGVRAEKLLPDGLRLVKEFHLGSNYLVNADVRLENTSEKPLALPEQELVVGTATPMGPDDNTFYIYGGVVWFDGKDSEICSPNYFSTNTTVLGFIHRTPKEEYRAGASNVVWAAADNQFFALLAMPKQPAEQVVARPVDLPALAKDLPSSTGIQTALVYPAQILAPNQSIERQIVFFAGPKEYRTLARIGEEFQNHADEVMNFGRGFASFWGIGSFFAKALLLAMNWLHDVTHVGYGWTIVLITVILRLAFWPFTAASVRSMKKMQALAPELKALKEKYKDDTQKFMQKQQELYRKHKVNPVSGCLPMLVQMPVFLGFFTMLRSAIELRGAHFLWVTDLSKPDTLFMIPGLTFLPFISTPDGLPFNLLPLLMVGTMIWQAHLQPPSPGMDPSQQKIMRFMPVIFLAFLYNYSSGMALYMTVSTLAGVLQTRLTKTIQAPATPPGPPQKLKSKN